MPTLKEGPQTAEEWLKQQETDSQVRLYSIDGHTYPQTKQLLGWHTTINEFDELIRLEKKNFDNLNSKMGINLVHLNSTSTDKWKNVDLRWSAKMKLIVYKFYQKDFEILGYSKGSRLTRLEGSL